MIPPTFAQANILEDMKNSMNPHSSHALCGDRDRMAIAAAAGPLVREIRDLTEARTV
jgi:hypothetical protein